MTDITDFKGEARDKIDSLTDEPFPDALPELERFFGGRTGGLTRNQVVWFEMYWREHGTAKTTQREIWEALKRAPERQRFANRRPAVRREVVRIFGHKTVRYRDVRTGRWARRPRRR
ncbi:MAG: hypothetical protein JRN51_07345 [Nitrososphaerota archaeon]|jgi:hypothetical protein|nr:hypothetical protein [Ferrimicrobium acidiphilum]MDG6912922.1 hypothetical protein [Nitrososphaerota archaeon]MDG6980914.1 hypothetical protein [Nitrososphaerota archaeon]